MYSRRKTAFVLSILLLSVLIIPAQAQYISSYWIDSIEDESLQVDAQTTAEIVVVVVPSIKGNNIRDKSGNEISDIVKLGVYLFNEMSLETFDGTQVGIGKKGRDNGVLIIIAVEEQKWRIEIGYGLEGDITDIESNNIAQQYLIPQLKQGNFGEAVYDTVVALGEEIPTNSQADSFPIRGYYYYELDSSQNIDRYWWDMDFYGLPLWLVIILALLGFALPVVGSRSGRGGGSGGGGSTGKW